MDPNHWNTYNLQYGHSTTGGLPPTHTSFNRLDLTSGLGLSHTLQATHSPIGSRTMAALPSVNYSLGMPLLDTMSTQQSHKTMSLGQSQILFDSQIRVAPEQQSPTFGRYESQKASMTRSQLLEAARMWAPASSLYNHQLLQDVQGSNMGTHTTSPTSGSGIITSKSNQLQMHDPPPAHSSNTSRVAQRSSHSTELLYGRGTESLMASSLAQLYSSNPIGKQSISNNQQQSLHRQAELHNQPSYSTHNDIEDLSSNSQSQLYGSYANMSVGDSQDFSSNQLSGDLSYEAVSPAPPMSEGSQVSQEQSNFSIVHFPDLASLTSEHAHSLADKFQENDYRLKMDSRLQQQQDVLSQLLPGQRQDLGMTLKIPKDNLHMLSMQMSQRGSQFQSGLMMGQGMNMSPSPGNSMNIGHSISMSQVSQNNSLTSSSMQQAQAPIPIQALADSTTKPKRTRKKKKDLPPQAMSPINDIKKSNSQTTQMSQHGSILNMPPSSPHISALSMGVHVSQANQMQQQTGFRNSGSSNQFTSQRDAHRAQTPSVPQNYSLQDHQSISYTPSPSPKMPSTPNQNLMRAQSDFALPTRMGNEKPAPSYKQVTQQLPQHRKSTESTAKSNSCQNNQVFRSNIPDNQQHVQNFAGLTGLMASNGQRGSPMQDNRSSLSRMQSFAEQSSHHKLVSQMSPLGQPSPQSTDNVSYSSGKALMGHVGHITSQSIGMSHSPIDSRPVSVDHGYDPGHQPALIDAQDGSQFQLDFTGQPFLDQLVGVQPPLALPPSSYGHSSADNGEAVFTTLVSQGESARIHQQHDSASGDGNFRPTYHGEAVHEIRPIGSLGGNLGMDDVSFNAFFDTQRPLDHDGVLGHQHPGAQSYTSEPEKMTLTFMPHVVEDDELGHFSLPGTVQPVGMARNTRDDPGQKRESFQDSFLSYLQGHKQETLSSVSSSAVTKKPQLPKYIPEPRRPRPAVVHKDSSNLSDSEDTVSLSGRTRDSNISDNDSSHKSESDQEGYSVQRTSELAVKIRLPKSKKRSRFGPFAESTLLKDSMRTNKERGLKRKRRKSKHKENPDLGTDYWPGNGSEEEGGAKPHPEAQRPSPPPMRISIGRKAKEKCIEKTTKQKTVSGSGSSTEEDLVPYKGKSGFKSDGSDKNYDSDKDPIWMPFAVDLKQGHDFEEKRKKLRRPRMRIPSTKSSRSSSQHSSQPGVSKSVASSSPSVPNVSKADNLSLDSSETSAANHGESPFQIGMYMIEKKDLHNYESYPIWRLEAGNMIRKFEMCSESIVVQHVAVGTFSNWVKSMESQFQPIRVQEVQSDSLRVEVVEECRPKAPSNGRLEIQYEDDPLVETFNIYLQVFLSQALEPTFLSAIIEANEKFYVEAINEIDRMIEHKCQEITRLAQWKSSFLECLHRCPLMKEIDRPNLKQPCQASENSSPPTIKSVLLSGIPYDRFLLTEFPNRNTDSFQEFMIGKVAAHYVRTYHNLYHYKYWLHQRCQAKVKTMTESNRAEYLSNEVILDKCLENTSWVLSLFDSLKNLLKFGEETPR